MSYLLSVKGMFRMNPSTIEKSIHTVVASLDMEGLKVVQCVELNRKMLAGNNGFSTAPHPCRAFPEC